MQHLALSINIDAKYGNDRQHHLHPFLLPCPVLLSKTLTLTMQDNATAKQ